MSEMTTKSPQGLTIQPRIRVWVHNEAALGPGKAELLRLVRRTGSIVDGAKTMGMSYMRAWTLIQTMNRCFKKPLLIMTRGGQRGGGTELTESGGKVLECYEEMEKAALRAMSAHWRQLRKMLRN